MKAKMQLFGLDEYMDELSQAVEDIDSIARDTLFETALNMQEEMKNYVPILTGRLYEHILIDGPHSDGNYHFVEVGVIHNLAFTPKDVAIQANVIEFGSARQAAQPFLRPVFRKKRNIFWKAFQKVAAKYGYHF